MSPAAVLGSSGSQKIALGGWETPTVPPYSFQPRRYEVQPLYLKKGSVLWCYSCSWAPPWDQAEAKHKSCNHILLSCHLLLTSFSFSWGHTSMHHIDLNPVSGSASNLRQHLSQVVGRVLSNPNDFVKIVMMINAPWLWTMETTPPIPLSKKYRWIKVHWEKIRMCSSNQ